MRSSTAAKRTSGLIRIPDAKQAYLDLYAGNRALAAKLLNGHEGWVAAQRPRGGPQARWASTAGSGASLDDFDHWIQERAQIAAQTAALTRAGTAASWR